MTLRRFLLFTLIQWVLLTLVKIYFFQVLRLQNINLQYIYYWIVTFGLGALLVRRLGIMNYLEGIFVASFWMLEGMLADLLITSLYTGLRIFGLWQFWVGYLFLGLSVFLFHKKRHIAVRHGLPVPTK